jgi:hypothetical protein
MAEIDYDALAKKFGAIDAAPKVDYDKLATQFGAVDAKQPRREAGAMDRVGAAVAGVNKGFFSDLLGLPVDAAANVVDLGKAAIGYTASKVTGAPPPEWTAPFDRRGVPGSSEWLAARINQGADALGVRSPIDNPAPHDTTSRVLYSGGRVAGSSIVPNPNVPIAPANQLRNFLMAEAGGLSAGGVGEVAPEWAGVAGMVPQVVGAASVAATKRAIRGNEAGRREMEQRIQDFKNAGVDNPSVGLASGNKTVQGIENMLSLTPGSVGAFEKNKQALLSGMQGKTNAIRDAISGVYGPVEAGQAIQADLKGAFKDRIGNTYSTLNDRVEAAVGPNTAVPVSETLIRSGQLTTPIKGAEETSSLLIQPRIKNINEAIQADAGGTPAKTVFVGGQMVQVPSGHGTRTVQQPGIVDAAGNPITVTIPATPPTGLPFSALKELRTKIGKEAQSNAIMGTPEQADFKQLYGAMSQDMKNGVAMADLQNGVLPASGGSATTALNRANTYYSRAMDKVDALNPLANRSTPEGAYNSVTGSLNAGPSTYERVRNAVTPETRAKVVSTVINDLGMAKDGMQNAARDVWSPRTFLTNYSKINENGGGVELFKRLPGGQKYAADLQDVAKAAEMVSDASKVWANPSGTTAAAVSRGTLYALTAGAFINPVAAAGTAGALALGNQVSQRLLLNPDFVGWLAKTPKVTPQGMQSYMQTLIANADKTNDPQYKKDVSEYLQLVQQGINSQGNAGNQ